MIFISAVLNNFIMKRLKVKSSDLTSDKVNDTDSKPYNNTGIHFEKNKLQYYIFGCNPTNLAKNGIH